MSTDHQCGLEVLLTTGSNVNPIYVFRKSSTHNILKNHSIKHRLQLCVYVCITLTVYTIYILTVHAIPPAHAIDNMNIGELADAFI